MADEQVNQERRRFPNQRDGPALALPVQRSPWFLLWLA